MLLMALESLYKDAEELDVRLGLLRDPRSRSCSDMVRHSPCMAPCAT